MTASKTILPVVGVPVDATPLRGLDALLSIMQMPSEVGVATVSVGEKGAENAALFAAAALGSRDPWPAPGYAPGYAPYADRRLAALPRRWRSNRS